jgi:thioredoxin reductase (NADPH)
MDPEALRFDIIILGSGPAGLQAAVHAARAKVSVAVVGRMQKSSLYKAHIENYCCMDATLAGQEILDQGKKQAERFGALFFEQDVLELDRGEDGLFRARLESGQNIVASSLVLAMGIARNRLNAPGEKEFIGKGVSYCVDCDANFYRDQAVVVVGDESAACSGALRLLLTSSEVHMVLSRLDVGENLQMQIESSGIHRHEGRKIKAIQGKEFVESVLLDDGETIECSGVFIELGAKGALELAAGLDVALDPESMKYISTNKKQETNVPGVYAAGDICGPPWQMAKAVGEGCVAGMEAANYAKRLRAKSA